MFKFPPKNKYELKWIETSVFQATFLITHDLRDCNRKEV